MTRVARRQENSHEVNNISLPNIRATAFNKHVMSKVVLTEMVVTFSNVICFLSCPKFEADSAGVVYIISDLGLVTVADWTVQHCHLEHLNYYKVKDFQTGY